jgi:glycosyltransferase 2 family protein
MGLAALIEKSHDARFGSMRLVTGIALLAGLALVTVLVAWYGFRTVALAMSTMGAGVLLLPLVYAPHLAGGAASWRLQFLPGRQPPFFAALRALWIGLSIETLVPAASLGAEVMKARLLLRSGVRGNDAAASVVVDLTVQALVLAIWGLVGVGALAILHADAAVVWSALGGAAGLAAGVGGFLLAQRAGMFGFLTRAGGKTFRAGRWQGIIDSAAQLDQTIRALYDQPQRILLACAIRCLSRSLLAVELWLVAKLMGQPIAPVDAVMILGIIGALRAATFFIPGGWGVQEGGFVILGGLLGLAPDFMLAMSLATRARELMVGVPGVVVWQIVEGRSLRRLVGQRSG